YGLLRFVHPRREFGQRGLGELGDDATSGFHIVAVLACGQERPRLYRAQHFLERWWLALDDPHVRDLSPRVNLGIEENLSPRKRLGRERRRHQRQRSGTRIAFSILRGTRRMHPGI